MILEQDSNISFDRWAIYYDLIHTGLSGDVEFYVSLAAAHGGNVLELGVGTGRIALPLVLAGFEVTGLDNSAAMLALCQSKMEMAEKRYGKDLGKLALVHADARAFDLGKYFPCITMPYRGFMHLLTPDDQRRCLACVYKHLARNGVFILDTWLPDIKALSQTQRKSKSGALKLCETFRLPDEGIVVLHYQISSIDEANQLIMENHVVRETDPRGRLIEEATLAMTRAWTTRREMEHLLALSGFEIASVFGDFEGGPVTPKTSEIIWVLKKASKGKRAIAVDPK